MSHLVTLYCEHMVQIAAHRVSIRADTSVQTLWSSPSGQSVLFPACLHPGARCRDDSQRSRIGSARIWKSEVSLSLELFECAFGGKVCNKFIFFR